jgi:hypothetical protein
VGRAEAAEHLRKVRCPQPGRWFQLAGPPCRLPIAGCIRITPMPPAQSSVVNLQSAIARSHAEEERPPRLPLAVGCAKGEGRTPLGVKKSSKNYHPPHIIYPPRLLTPRRDALWVLPSAEILHRGDKAWYREGLAGAVPERWGCRGAASPCWTSF